MSASMGCFVFPRVAPPSQVTRLRGGFFMSALVILECNSCAAISAPHLSAEKARETEAPEGWTVAIDGEDLDYCPECTAPAGSTEGEKPDTPVAPATEQFEDPRSADIRRKLRLAQRAIVVLGDSLRAIAGATGSGVTRHALQSVASLGALHADQALAELEK